MLNQISWEMLHMVSLVLVEAFVEVAHGKLHDDTFGSSDIA